MPDSSKDGNDNSNGISDTQITWKVGWNYEITELADHLHRPVFKLSKRLEKLTGLQVTSPDLKGKEYKIPFFHENDFFLDDASGDLMVNYATLFRKK